MEKQNKTTAVIILAVLGAALGAVPSMFLWIVLGKTGIIAAISGFLMMMGELIACDRFTRKYELMNHQAAIFICSLVMIFDIYLCERIIWSWDLMDILFSDGMHEYSISLLDCFWNFHNILNDFEIGSMFAASLIQSYAMAALGAVAGCVKILKSKNIS